ncbi:MAG: vWA domain-containing protein [Pseudomonadota bacterium]
MPPADENIDNAPSPNNKWRIYGAGSIAIIVLLFLFFWLSGGEPGESIRELLVQSRDHYEEKYENVSELAKSLETPDKALEFARNKISVSIYEGRLQTPEEVLKTRIANPADKAIFLKALLEELQVTTTAKATGFPEDARKFLVIENEVDEKTLPESLRELMTRIGYQGDDTEDHIKYQLGLVIENLQEGRKLVDAAAARAGGLIDLEGKSSAQPVFLDWVWLEGADGKIYDPILEGRDRPETFRVYNDSPAVSRFSLHGVNSYGEVGEMIAWEGNAYGQPVSVTFVPAVDTAGRLAGDPDMSDVEVWAPVLSVGADAKLGSAVNREGDVAPLELIESLLSGDGVPEFSAPKVNSLEIRSVNVSQWPRVNLGLAASVQGTPRWHGSHFSVTIADQNPQVRIEQPFSNQTNAIILADQSGSTLENDYHQWIKRFGKTLASGLSSQQRFAIATYGYQPVFHKLFDNFKLEGYPQTAYEAAWDQPVRGQMDFTTALDHALNAVLVELGNKPGERTDIILLTDGKAGRLTDDEWFAELGTITKRAQELKASISPVVMGTSSAANLAKVARETGGKLIRITQPGVIDSQASALANELAGGMAISFRMPLEPDFKTDEIVPFELALEGFDGNVASRLTVPEAINRREPGIYLNVSSGGNSTSRPIVALGEKYKYPQMTGSYRVYLAAGRYNTNQLLAGRLNNWITYYDIETDNDAELEKAAQSPRISVAEMQTINGLSNAVGFGLTAEQNVRFPLLAVKRSYAEDLEGGDGEQVAIVNELDAPAWSPLTANAAAKLEVARAGLLLNDIESRLNNSGENLTRDFAEASDVISVTTQSETSVLIDNSSLAGSSDSQIFRHSEKDNVFWHGRANTGQWRGFGIWDDIPLKGSRDVEIAARFADIQTAIGAYNYSVKQSAALGAALTGAEAAAAMPAAVALGGLIAFKSEELKLWCYSTIMLGYVNESIAGEEDAILDKSAKAAEARAAKLCKMDGGPQDFGKNAFKAAAKAFLEEWANQHEIPQAEDPTANLRDAYDKAQRMYKHFFPELKKGEKPGSKDRLQMLISAIDKYGNGDGPTLQTQLVDKGFKWGTSSFSPKFRENMVSAIAAEIN